MTRILERKWLFLALIHLMVVTLGAFNFDWDRLGRMGEILNVYGIVSGAGSSYGFFAPGVEGQLGVHFDLISADGKIKTVNLESGKSHEAQLRVGNLIEQFQNENVEDSKAVSSSVAASFAGTLFGRYPETKQVVVRLESFFPVSMAEFRQGKRPEWKPIYQIQFAID